MIVTSGTSQTCGKRNLGTPAILNIITNVFGLHYKIIYVFDMNELKIKLFFIHFDAHHSFATFLGSCLHVPLYEFLSFVRQ